MKKWLLGGVGSTLVLILLTLLAVPMLMLLLLDDDQDQAEAGMVGGVGGLSAAVPAEYVEWLLKAGAICPEVSAALLASQLAAESNFNPTAVSPVGAQGIAQIMPFNFGMLRDDNGNGVASALDPADAIMFQGRFMCSFAPMFRGGASGDQLVRFMLAAYNAGPGAVLPSGCGTANTTTCRPRIPQNGETPPYVDRIMANLAQYQGADPTTIAADGAWIHPVASYTTGGTFRQVGRHWAMCGWHTGYDYAAAQGSPVKAAFSGTVIHASWGSDAGGTGAAYGNQVIIAHPNGMRSYYDHLSAFAVSPGDQVTTGQLIGQVGQTGNAFGAHLHFELTKAAPFTCDNFIDPHAFIQSHLTAPTTTKTTAGSTALTAKVIAAAKSQLGVRYSYGGGSLDGPSANMSGVVGFDCSSLVRYAWYQGTGRRITLPRTSEQQAAQLTKVTTPQPGDLVVFNINGNSYSHVGLYLGGGQMIHAPNPRKTVEITTITSGYYANQSPSYRRPA